MSERRKPQYPPEAFDEAYNLKKSGVSYNGIVAALSKKYPRLKYKTQAVRLVQRKISEILEKT